MSYFEQPPVLYSQYKPKILDAISQRFCTLPQIKKYSGIPWAVDVSDVLTWMLDNNEIVRLENPNLTAYFLPEKVPVKSWSNGDGRVAVEFAEKEREKKTEKNHRKFIEVSEADVERYAAEAEEAKLKDAQIYVAEKCGLGWSTLMKKFKEFPELKAAFERGRKTYHANHKPDYPPPVPLAPKKRKANPNFTRENFYNWGKQGFGSKEIAAELGISFQSVNTILRWNREMQDALNSGLNNQTDEPLAHNEIAEMESETVTSQTEEDQVQPETCHKTGCANPIPNGEFYYCSDDCMLDDAITSTKTETPVELVTKIFAGCQNCGLPFAGFPKHIGRDGGWCDDCLAGRLIVQDPRPEAAEPSNTPLNTLEEFDPAFQIHFNRAPSETISFGSAGQIELFADLNLFLMDETSREFLNKLITDIQRFREDQRFKEER